MITVNTAEINTTQQSLSGLFRELDNVQSAAGRATGSMVTFGREVGRIRSVGDLASALRTLPSLMVSIGTQAATMTTAFGKLGEMNIGGRLSESFTQAWQESDQMGNKITGAFRRIGPAITKSTELVRNKISAFQAKGGIMATLTGKAGLLTIAKTKLNAAMVWMNKNLTFKAIGLGIVNGLKLLLKGMLTLVTIGVKLFNLALKANPIFWVVGAVGLLVGAFTGLVRWLNRSTAAADAVRERNEAIAESIEEVSNRLDSNRQAHTNNLRSIERTTAVNGNLINRLQDLASAENLNDAQRAQKIATIRELNDSIDGLNLVYDAETGLLDENSRLQFEQLGLRNNITEASAVAEATQSRLNEALFEEAELLQKIERLDIPGQKEELAQKLESGAITQRNYNELIAQMQENYENLQSELRYTQSEIGYLETAWYDSLTNMTYLTSHYVTDQRLTWDSLNEHQQGVMNNLKSMITDYTDHAQNRMSTLSDEVSVTGREMIDNMIENQRVLETWSDNIALLAERGIDEGLLEEMRQMGPEGAAQVAAMVAMCDDELNEMNEVYRNGAQVATDALATQLGEGFEEAVNMASHFVNDARTTMVDEIAGADFESIGASIPDGAARGVARSTEYINAMRDLAEDGKDTYTSAIGYNSPSRVYMGYGESIVTGLANGINNLKSQPISRMQQVAQNMQRKYNNVNSVYANIGRDIMNGLNQGLLNREGSVMATANRIANNIAATMRRALQINSPSRVMREGIGRFIPEGVAAGIDKYAGAAIGSVEKLAYDMVNIKIPSVESMINMGPSLSYAGAGGAYGGNVTNVDRTNDNRGLFEGATINWHGKQDIRETMEEIAWEIQSQDARFI